jgi:hypothetical protein
MIPGAVLSASFLFSAALASFAGGSKSKDRRNEMRKSVLYLGLALLMVGPTFAMADTEAQQREGKTKFQQDWQDAYDQEKAGNFCEAVKRYRALADAMANPEWREMLEKKADGLVKAAEQAIAKAKAVTEAKNADQQRIIEALCECWPIVLGWRGHRYGAAASGYFDELKAKLTAETKQQAEKQAAELTKQAGDAAKAKDYVKALTTYQKIYDQAPFTKEAKKCLPKYLELKASVKLPTKNPWEKNP